jgi:hypothetical protein
VRERGAGVRIGLKEGYIAEFFVHSHDCGYGERWRDSIRSG